MILACISWLLSTIGIRITSDPRLNITWEIQLQCSSHCWYKVIGTKETKNIILRDTQKYFTHHSGDHLKSNFFFYVPYFTCCASSLCFYFSPISAGSALVWAKVVQLQSAEDDHERADRPGHAACWQEYWRFHRPSGALIEDLHVRRHLVLPELHWNSLKLILSLFQDRQFCIPVIQSQVWTISLCDL